MFYAKIVGHCSPFLVLEASTYLLRGDRIAKDCSNTKFYWNSFHLYYNSKECNVISIAAVKDSIKSMSFNCGIQES